MDRPFHGRQTIQMNTEELLRHHAWMRPLARSLVRDDSLADDVLQQAWLAATRDGSVSVRSPVAWLSTLVRRAAGRMHREDSRRRRREHVVARRRQQLPAPSSHDVLERAEMQRQVVESVLSLEEPYRSTILLRYFEGLSPKEIAQRESIPTATVWTRLRRALESLRQKLDGVHQGRRKAWMTSLLPIAGIQLTTEKAASAASVTSGTGAVTTTSGVLGTAGGAIVSQKLAIAVVSVAALVGVGVGISVGASHFGADMSRDEAKAQFGLVDQSAHEDLRRRYEQTASKLTALRSELKTASRGAASAAARPEVPAAASQQQDDTVASSKALSAFDLQEIKDADWTHLGRAAFSMRELMAEIMETQRAGKPPPIGLASKLQAKNQQLLALAASLQGKLPTHVIGNGEFTHPAVLTRLMDGMLAAHDLPLSTAQRESVEELVRAYEIEYAELQDDYGAATPNLAKVLDELEMKLVVMEDVKALLSAEQLEFAYPEATEGTIPADLLSPGLMTMSQTSLQHIGSAEAARENYMEYLGEVYELDSGQLAALEEPISAWEEAIQPYLETPSETIEMFGSVDQAIAEGRAHARVVESMVSLPGLDDGLRDRILGSVTWRVTRVAASKEKSEQGPQ